MFINAGWNPLIIRPGGLPKRLGQFWEGVIVQPSMLQNYMVVNMVRNYNLATYFFTLSFVSILLRCFSPSVIPLQPPPDGINASRSNWRRSSSLKNVSMMLRPPSHERYSLFQMEHRQMSRSKDAITLNANSHPAISLQGLDRMGLDRVRPLRYLSSGITMNWGVL